jgi:hypothetical protein
LAFHFDKLISIQLKLIDARYKADNAAWNRKNFLFKFQIYNIEKNFIRPRDAMEERTLSNICVGFYEKHTIMASGWTIALVLNGIVNYF